MVRHFYHFHFVENQHLELVHITLYAVLCLVVWVEYLRHHRELNKMRLFIGVFLAPLLMGGLIELAQANCTGGNRSGDWLDFAANSIGVVVVMPGLPGTVTSSVVEGSEARQRARACSRAPDPRSRIFTLSA